MLQGKRKRKRGHRWALNFETNTMQENSQLGEHGGHKLRKDPIRKRNVQLKSFRHL